MSLGEFIDRLDDQQRSSFEVLHSLFIDYPGVQYTMRYSIPFYDYISWMCYINPLRKHPGQLELCFIQGNRLVEYGCKLESKGRKQIAGIRVGRLDDALLDDILNTFAEAMVLNETMASRKKSNPS